MNDSLDLLLADGIIDDVLGRLKSGKEADVWLVQHEGAVAAAKIYKDRAVRSFKNNSGYTEGRKTRNTRTQRAMDRGSRFGKKAAEDAWKEAEANALFKLHAAGVRVPTPHLFYEGVLVMDLVIGPDGSPAPRLVEAHLGREQAAEIYADLRAQMVKMLCADVIHGDLSPYNVLLGVDGPVIIDLPQTIDAAVNNRASFYFQRDVDNIRNFLAGFDRSLQGRRGDAKAIWRTWEKRELTPDYVPPEAPQEPQRVVEVQAPRQQRGRERGGPREQRDPRDRGSSRDRGGPVVVHVSRLSAGGSNQEPAREGRPPRGDGPPRGGGPSRADGAPRGGGPRPQARRARSARPPR
jgi:RIO kinase 1